MEITVIFATGVLNIPSTFMSLGKHSLFVLVSKSDLNVF